MASIAGSLAPGKLKEPSVSAEAWLQRKFCSFPGDSEAAQVFRVMSKSKVWRRCWNWAESTLRIVALMPMRSRVRW